MKLLSIFFFSIAIFSYGQEKTFLIENIGKCLLEYNPIGFYDSTAYKNETASFPEDFGLRISLVPLSPNKLKIIDSVVISNYKKFDFIIDTLIFNESDFKNNKDKYPIGSFRIVSYDTGGKVLYDLIIIGFENSKILFECLTKELYNINSMSLLKDLFKDEIDNAKVYCFEHK